MLVSANRKTNPIQNYLRLSMNPELLNAETFMGSLYPRKCETETNLQCKCFPKELERACFPVCYNSNSFY